MSGRSLALVACGTGRLGTLAAGVAAERGHRVVARLDSRNNASGEGLSREALRDVDVVLELSVASATLRHVRLAAEAGCAVVVGTTGWDRAPGAREEMSRVQESTGAGILVAPNFSLGMLLFRRVVERAAELLAADAEFDAWIEEAHHAGKADHPSGTALMLASAILERVPRKKGVLTSLPEGPVDGGMLLVASSRGGHQPGLHRVVIDGAEETITMVHEARSRRVFAVGVVRAAEWLAGRSGYFTLEDVLAGAGRKEGDA